jgi:hypothetical protein
VHQDHEDGKADGDLPQALAPASGHHRDPIAPGEPRFVPRKPQRGAGLDHGISLVPVIPGRAKREPGIHGHDRRRRRTDCGYGFRAAAARLPE